jgi:hypothetical protein
VDNVKALKAEIEDLLLVLRGGLKRADEYSENTLTGLRDSLIGPCQRVEHMLEEQDLRLMKAGEAKAAAEKKKAVKRKVRQRRTGEQAAQDLAGMGTDAEVKVVSGEG